MREVEDRGSIAKTIPSRRVPSMGRMNKRGTNYRDK